MAVFNAIATWELFVLLAQFLLGNSYLLLPANPAACCRHLLYPRVVLLTGCLLLTTVISATLLLSVRMSVSADKKGVATGWKKLRALLLLAIGLSAASTFLAVSTFEAGRGYRKGCLYTLHPLAVVAMVIMAVVEHGCAAWLVAVAQD